MTLDSENKIIFVINTGGGSTKIAVFSADSSNNISLVFKDNIRHNIEEMRSFEQVLDQKDWRKELILTNLEARNIDKSEIIAVVSRGGLLKPMKGGTYKINEKMIDDIISGKVQAKHASNLSPCIADEFARDFGCPAFIVDPPCTDELIDCARISGNPLFERTSLTHALNIRHTARMAAKKLGKKYSDCRFVVVHLGSGISVTSHAGGQMIDINDSTAEGPFGTQRAGGLPIRQVLNYLMQNPEKLAELDKNLISNTGLVAYRGNDEFTELLADMKSGDAHAKLIFDAFVHQLAKSVGAFSAVLDGKLDAIVFTGGMAFSNELQENLEKRCSWIAPVWFFPGEEEMLALASGVIRVLSDEEDAKTYS